MRDSVCLLKQHHQLKQQYPNLVLIHRHECGSYACFQEDAEIVSNVLGVRDDLTLVHVGDEVVYMLILKDPTLLDSLVSLVLKAGYRVAVAGPDLFAITHPAFRESQS